MPGSEALRHNQGKADLSQLLDFTVALEMLAKVMEQGAIKYTPRNWLKGNKPDSEYLSSAMRHILAAHEGELYDDDTGCTHLAHAAWNMLACLRLNYWGEPDLDPNFDQEAFVARWSTP